MSQDVPYHGVKEPAGLHDVPLSHSYEGRFGRLFRRLPPLEATDEQLKTVAEHMFEEEETDPDQPGWGRDTGSEGADNPDLPAGYTYLGQFIDHDITFDPTSDLLRSNDPDALTNFRTPRFDLDSVYGAGPHDAPYLYESDGVRLRTQQVEGTEAERDLPRSGGRAIIGDPRNDENQIVSQLQLAVIDFHNNVADQLEDQEWTGRRLFEAARRETRWHYQWVVVHDFLSRIVGQEVVDDILHDDSDHQPYTVLTKEGPAQVGLPEIKLRFFGWKHYPFMPVEFSVAAYRFGHSMVRQRYELNDSSGRLQIFPDLAGFKPRQSGRSIDWSNFFPIKGSQPQLARRIDPRLALPLKDLTSPSGKEADPKSLALRNLRRGKALRLPSGQSVARAMNLPDELVLKPDEVDIPGDGTRELGEETPLWFYVLREAEVKAASRRLGPVGGRIVAEVLLGLVFADPYSYFRVKPRWTPWAGVGEEAPGREFNMGHFLEFARQ